MDETLLETWNRIASGDLEGIDVPRLQRKLIYICFEQAGSQIADERLAALRVAAHFSEDDRLRLVDPMIRDSDPRVRRYAFNLAVEARKAGITALKTCVGGKDEDLAAEALGLLITQVDISSSLHARQWLTSDFPRVRAGAAMLLGHIAGPSLSVRLNRMARNDPHPAVRTIAAESARRCLGELPKNEPRNFWEAGATPIDLGDEAPPAAQESEPSPVPTAPTRPVVPPPPVRNDARPTLYPNDAEAEEQEAEYEDVPVPPVPQRQAIVPSVPEGTPEIVDDTPRDWRDPAPLPSVLPTDPHALVKLMGRVGEGDRPAVHRAFVTIAEHERNTALRGWTPGSDPSTGRGVALMIAHLEDKRSASMLRHLLQEEADGVRAAACAAVGRVGTLSMIPPLSALLDDAVPEVRVEAIKGLTDLLGRTERWAMLRERLAPLTSDGDARVRTAAEDALASVP